MSKGRKQKHLWIRVKDETKGPRGSQGSPKGNEQSEDRRGTFTRRSKSISNNGTDRIKDVLEIFRDFYRVIIEWDG